MEKTLIRIDWRSRLGLAIKGEFPYSKELLAKRACDWKTCAVGSLTEPIERRIYYVKDQLYDMLDTQRTTYAPVDTELQDLGISFALSVEDGKYQTALEYLDLIEDRAKQLTNEKISNNSQD